MGFHPHVEGIKEYYVRIPADDKMREVALKLTLPTNKGDLPILEKMWESVRRAAAKRYELYDDMWAHGFISAVFQASNLAPYFYKNREEQKELGKEIERLTKRLSQILKDNQLDFQLIYAPTGIFKGFSFYEGFGESNRARIDQDKVEKLKISTLLPYLADTAIESISYAYTTGKAGKRVKVTRFVRSLAESNLCSYGTPLYEVISSVILALYGEDYTESDISNLLNRRKSKETSQKVIAKLAELSPSQYKLVRGSYAESFHVHVSTLDEAVEKVRKKKV